jgi:hypothetical protein
MREKKNEDRHAAVEQRFSLNTTTAATTEVLVAIASHFRDPTAIENDEPLRVLIYWDCDLLVTLYAATVISK